ncbi:hypothetical protein LNP04_10530 [Chryseobacterium sp. C-71]|uniref:hypothetical protein n=1 Tax=Chryseobacterium sp. C-71 TaxID=2893882 RepID=UPI001E60606E|nr:hypothetical protein [Chryseobacterium sp. C-71]UFH30417.1 hypothetical protein LNP04_10530 [Chryseobacterium sp. C-71]
MIVDLSKENKIEFRNDLSSNYWFGILQINEITHEFSFDNNENLDWQQIKDRLVYFVKHHAKIINLTSLGIDHYIKFTLGWESKIKYDLECVTILVNDPKENIFKIHPISFDDPYVSWSAHIYDNEGPKLRNVTRE